MDDERIRRLFEYLLDNDVPLRMLAHAADHARDNSAGIEGPRLRPIEQDLAGILTELTVKSDRKMPNFGP